MVSRLWPRLLLVALLPSTTLDAQTIRQPPTGGVIVFPEDSKPERPSHRPVPNDLDANMRPEDAVNGRLGHARTRKNRLDKFGDENTQADIQALAKRLAKDEAFVKSLKEKFSPEDIEKLLGQVGDGKGIGNDPALQKLLRQAMESGKVSDADKEKMRSWSDMLREKGIVEPPDASPAGEGRQDEGAGAAAGPGPGSMRPPPSPPRQPTPTLPPKRENGPEEWIKRNLDRAVSGFDRWKDSPAAQGWTNLFKGMGERLEKNPIATPVLAERAGRLTQYLPRFRSLMPNMRPPRIPDPYLPRLPNFGSMPRVSFSAPSTSGITPGKAFVWVILLAVLGVVLWRAGGFIERVRQARAAAWRLGPWPVRPEAVATRGELVRAFEHLALLCLGREARTHHHLELAAQIGGQPALDQERRQEAATALARLYEQARYTPDDERLADEDIHRARRELCYLAGVTAA